MRQLEPAVDQHGVVNLHFRVEWKGMPDNVTALHARSKRVNLCHELVRGMNTPLSLSHARCIRAVQPHAGRAVDVERHDVRLEHKLERDGQARDGRIAQLGGD